tara:strand:- start:132223 stop:133428 length:1206 start_codon:yes stop_codon:yes gene_type:complete
LGLLLCAYCGDLSAQQASGSNPFMAPSPYSGRQESQSLQPASQAQVYLEQQYSNQQQKRVQLGSPLHQTDPGWKQDLTQSLPPLYSQNRAQTRRGQSGSIRQVGATQTDYPSAFEAFSDDQEYPELETRSVSEEDYAESIDELCGGNCWGWTVLPTDLLYTSYLAGPKEPRMGLAVLNEKDIGWQMELEAGARVGILRYGTMDDDNVLAGWQLDIEGAGPPRLNIEEDLDLDAADFRVGVPLTWRQGAYQAKFAYYHTSAHVGDEYLKRHPGFQRINYVRDAFVLGGGYFVDPDLRLYAEIGYAFNTDGGAKPWELQFGAEFSPAEHSGIYGAPFWAINGYLREEVNWGGNVNFMFGWQWRGDRNNHLLRIGFQYLDGKTMQYSFYQNSERMVGFGTWYDF